MRYGSRLAALVAAVALSATALPALADSSDRADQADDEPAGQQVGLTITAPKATPLGQMDLPHLQLEAATLQAEFVRASLELDKARLNLRLTRENVLVAVGRAERAQRYAVRQRARLASYLDLMMTEGPSMDPGLVLLLTGPQSKDAMWKENIVFQQVTEDQTVDVDSAIEAQINADSLHAAAEVARTNADVAEQQVQEILAAISRRADEVTAKAEESFTDNQQAASFSEAQVLARNTAARTAWRAYLNQLRDAQITPPDQARLANPARLPDGLKALRGDGRKPIPGVALTANNVTVLPRQAVDAVSRAFTMLRKPYVAGSAGPETFDCAGLVKAAYPAGNLGASPDALFEATRRVSQSTAQVGDLVFFANRGAGIHHVGIYLGGDLMLAADGKASQVGVLAFPEKPYAVTRPTLSAPKNAHRAPEGDGSTKMSCGVELLAGGATSASMVTPISEGHFNYSAKFGQPGKLWASGHHTGLDLAAPVGTQVLAARDGVVSISHPAWAGNLVTVSHDSGLATRYAHVSAIFVKPGEQVSAGQTIAAVGQLGNAVGPHLHFEVLISGTAVDPMLFLAGNKGGAGWGGFLNGMIPPGSLCPLASAQNHRLRCDAARAYDALAKSYRAEFGQSLCITDSYRSFAAQITAFAHKPDLAAVPGTSNHGWGLAVDLCGGIQTFGSRQFAWMEKHAPLFGWVHPKWSGENGGKPEPWHWEFGRLS